MSEYAWIRGSYLSGQKLVYHRATWDDDRIGKNADGAWVSRTDCGLIRWKDDGTTDDRGTHLTEVLAHRIARPCLKCYPARRVP